MDSCFWSSSCYWTTRQATLKRDRTKTGIKIAHSSRTGWFVFIFSKFHRGAIEIFRSLDKREAWFYQEPINQYRSFSAWCIVAKHFESVLKRLQALSDIELEFVIPQTNQGLQIPAPFEALKLQFFEVGSVRHDDPEEYQG
ncbi:MAG: hypothetical protein JOZ78_11570 [Chroococcidiopsidaceae cyanobacterium CP_BM_ER_R8_30]|nr:hypothetical protein [Chroococcidiopsidaceae cyanobacterium CP_BM_ER_R8_30]